MLKFKEGKMMLSNLILIFALVVCCTMVVPRYNENDFYTIATYVIAAALVAMSVCQILLARKLFKIAKEESQTASKTEIV